MVQEFANFIITIAGVIILIILYFLPSFIASSRRHQNKAPIIVINLFFGWTLLGWVICLAWALSQVKNAADIAAK